MEHSDNLRSDTKSFNYYAMLILYCLALLPFLSLNEFKTMMGGIYSSLQSVSCVVLGLLVIFKVRRLHLDRFLILYIVIQVLIFGLTTINYGFSMGILVSIVAGIFLIMLMQEDLAVIVRALAIIAAVSLVLNFVYIFMRGANARIGYFIGGKNTFSVFLIPATVFVATNAYIRKGKLTGGARVFAVLSIGTILWGGSATGIVTAGAMVILSVLAWKHRPNAKVWLITLVLMHIALVFFLEVLSGTELWRRLMGVLGKEDTLTSRALIWEQTLAVIKNDWFLGVGRGKVISYVNHWGYRAYVGEAHNFVLELVLEGGVVSLALYLAMVWSAAKELKLDSHLQRTVLVGFVVMMVNGLAEAINNKMVVALMLGLLHACAKYDIRENKYSP